MNKYHDTKGRFTSQKVYNKGKYYTTIYPENTMLEVILKTYGWAIILVLALSAGFYLHHRENRQVQVCSLMVVECIGE